MTHWPRKLCVLSGIVVPLITGGLVTAQEGARLPSAAPTPAEVAPQAASAAPACPPATATPASGEVAAPSQVSWWARVKYRLRACFLGFPEEFEAPPLGASVYAFGRTQVANAEAAQMVLYRADFVEGCPTLTPRGRDQLAKIALLLARNFCPLIIEPTLCAPELDRARVLEVVNELGRCGFAIPPQRVMIGPPPAVGLNGVEAVIIYNNLLNQTLSGGARGGSAGGASGAGGTPGLGSGGRSGGPGQ